MSSQWTEKAQAEANVCERHHFIWTWPIEGGNGSVGVCDLCGSVTTGERDGIKKAEALREAADQIEKFRDWYPTSVFPSLDEALSDDYTPTTDQVAAHSYRHAYGELVPRNLRTWAREALDGPGCDNCGGWDCTCHQPNEALVAAVLDALPYSAIPTDQDVHDVLMVIREYEARLGGDA